MAHKPISDYDAGSQTRIKDGFFARHGNRYSLADANAVTDAQMDTILNDYVQDIVDGVEQDASTFTPTALS